MNVWDYLHNLEEKKKTFIDFFINSNQLMPQLPSETVSYNRNRSHYCIKMP